MKNELIQQQKKLKRLQEKPNVNAQGILLCQKTIDSLKKTIAEQDKMTNNSKKSFKHTTKMLCRIEKDDKLKIRFWH